MYVDVGVNLLDKRFRNDHTEVLERARDKGVGGVVVICNSPSDFGGLGKLVSIPGCSMKATVGIHPHYCEMWGASNAARIEGIARGNPMVAAIGECGLDYNRGFGGPEKQKAAFSAQVDIANRLQLPLFCHEREAEADFTAICSRATVPVLVHCFSTSDTEGVDAVVSRIQNYARRGWFIGVSTFVAKTGRGSTLRQALARIGPSVLRHVMIETDSPYMSPPGAPRRNEPAWVPSAAASLAEILGTSLDAVAAQTTANAKTFFRMV